MFATQLLHNNHCQDTRHVWLISFCNAGSEETAIRYIPDRKRDPRAHKSFETTIIASGDNPVQWSHFFVDRSFERELIVLKVLANLDDQGRQGFLR